MGAGYKHYPPILARVARSASLYRGVWIDANALSNNCPIRASDGRFIAVSESFDRLSCHGMTVFPTTIRAFALASTAFFVAPSQAQQIQSPIRSDAPAYAAIADLTLHAPLTIDGTVHSAVRIKGAEAAGVAPGHARFYEQVDVNALIGGSGALPQRIGYLVDVPFDADGRLPRLRDLRVIAFARPVPGQAGQLQLISPNAQQPWSPQLDAMVRAIITESVSPNAPPQITGIGNAFHVPGTIPGEGETQIFLNTANRAPISISVLRRPNQERRWSVSTGDIVDNSAGPPKPETLLWYRLACGLPDRLPDASLAGQEPANAEAARDDYQFVLRALGPCGTSR